MKNNIKQIIENKCLKPSAIIRKTGLSRSSFYSIANEKSVPSLANARIIAEALGEKVDTVFPNDKFEGTSTEKTNEE